MKCKALFSLLLVLAALALGALFIGLPAMVDAQGPETQSDVGAQAAMGMAFTYQGRLTDGGSLADGTYDFQFRLYDAASGGALVASANRGNVTVTDGLFTVELDFGSGAFTGDARWLEIGVRPGTSTGAYTTLSPRQELTPAPYALALPGLWTQQNMTSTNLIGGYSGNSVTDGVVGATIGGGGESGNTNRVTDNYGTVGGGRSNRAGDSAGTTSDHDHATVGGGGSNTASGKYATVPGGYQAAATHHGEMAYASGMFASNGDAQTSVYVLRSTSTTADLTELFLDGSSERLTIANNRTLTFDILVVARSSGGTSAGYNIVGVIENSGGNTALIGPPGKISSEEDPSWDANAVADDTNDALQIRVTGAAGTTIRWVATVRTVEVSY